MKLKLIFDTIDLDYVLREEPYARRFISLLQDSVSAGWTEPLHTNHKVLGFSKTRQELMVEYTEKLNQSIYYVNNFLNLSIKSFSPTDNFALDSAQLNEIHYEFESNWKIHNYPKVNPLLKNINSKLSDINNYVHLLETVLFETVTENNYEFFVATHFGSQLGEIKHCNLEIEDYDYFTMDVNWGDLMIGYSTIGKSLLHCWASKDIDLVKARGVAPQRVMSTNMIAYFINPARKGYEFINDYHKWYVDNELDNYGYNFFDKRNSNGYLVAGNLDYAGDRTELLGILSTQTLQGFELFH